MTVELAGTTLSHLTQIEVHEHARLIRHPVPGMDGDLIQTQGRPSVVVQFQGIFYGPTASDDLGSLRSAYLERQPVNFYTASVDQGYFSQVIISRLEVSQRAGCLDQFDYICEVLEYVPPPPPATTHLLDSIDAGLSRDAASYMDDVQNGLAEVSNMVDLAANLPSFTDFKIDLSGMLELYQQPAGSIVSALQKVKELF